MIMGLLNARLLRWGYWVSWIDAAMGVERLFFLVGEKYGKCG